MLRSPTRDSAALSLCVLQRPVRLRLLGTRSFGCALTRSAASTAHLCSVSRSQTIFLLFILYLGLELRSEELEYSTVLTVTHFTVGTPRALRIAWAARAPALLCRAGARVMRRETHGRDAWP